MSERDRGKWRLALICGTAVVVAALIGGGAGLVLARNQKPAIAEANPVSVTSRDVPQAIAQIPLDDEGGRRTDLAAFRGRIVILADFMTSCQEECPITTGALLAVERSLADAHLLKEVTIVEVTVDPWRDSPSRFRAYESKFDIPWTLLTGKVANLNRLWSWFGVLYERVVESNPPDINWQTGKPYTFDITHTDDVFVLDQSGNERAVSGGNANVGGNLPRALEGLLDSQGRQSLKDAGYGSWTPADLLQAVAVTLGQTIPLPNSN